MAARRPTPLIVLTLLFAATIAAVRWAGSPGRTREPTVRPELPASAGPWKGSEMLFCQNEKCMLGFPADGISKPGECPKCGGTLERISLAEKKILPPDTTILKKLYRDEDGAEVFATVVVTGDQRASIHRPQWCLPAQGYRIEDSRVLRVPIRTGGTLDVMLLDVTGPHESGRKAERPSAYAYWFVGRARTTPHHSARLLLSTMDNLLHGVNQRWAFLSVATNRSSEADRCVERIERFIADFYPLIDTSRPPDIVAP
jgi:hypothetical protein